MRIIVIEPNEAELFALIGYFAGLYPSGEVTGFADTVLAPDYCYYKKPDVLFTDILLRKPNA